MSRFLFSAFFIFIFNLCFSQNESNIWYFGENAGVNFNTGVPQPLTDGQLNTNEGCASISDKNGKLLFYTDGVTIWNRNHVVMQNGSGLLGHISSTQAAVIVPQPGNPGAYYVFTTDQNASVVNNGLCYSIVDMTQDGGLGAVISGKKNVQLFAPSAEKLLAVKHSNDVYVWIIAKKRSSNVYVSYLLDCNGLGQAVESVAGDPAMEENIGCLAASPDGRMIATTYFQQGIEYYDYDNTNGLVSNPRYISLPPENYGICFSPGGNLIYTTNISSGSIYQFNLNAGTPADIENSKYKVGDALGNIFFGGAIQPGPDNKLYIPEYFSSTLSVINKPDIAGPGCDLKFGAVSLGDKRALLGLPPLVQVFHKPPLPEIQVQNNCTNRKAFFSFSPSGNSIDSVKWSFGDIMNGTSNLFSTSYIYPSGGDYNVTLIRYFPCFSDTLVKKVHIEDCKDTPIAGIINAYAAVDSFDLCDNAVYTSAIDSFRTDDYVLIIQMKGAGIDTSNTSAFGRIDNINNAGVYEFNYVSAVNPGEITLKYKLLNSYDPTQRVQIVRVPRYQDVEITGELTAQKWDGRTGGILAFEAIGEIKMSADISVNGKGFSGGAKSAFQNIGCGVSDYALPDDSPDSGEKGEGIARLSALKSHGRGAGANGGGGGNAHNAGGGGGSNYSAGGGGGDQFPCATPLSNGGVGGYALKTYLDDNRIFLGGGGGGGSQNEDLGSDGNNGGGLIMIKGATIISNGFFITADGLTADDATGRDGAGGGGAGGSIILNISELNNSLVLTALGGRGGNTLFQVDCHGPGGGGSGGLIRTSLDFTANLVYDVSGGLSGLCSGGTQFGSGDGSNGIYLPSLQWKQSFTTFVPHKIDTLYYDDPVCVGGSLKLFVKGNFSDSVKYNWSGPDNFISINPNPEITGAGIQHAGIYKINITDGGCSIPERNIQVAIRPVDSTKLDAFICQNDQYTLPDGSTVNQTGIYKVTLQNRFGCDSVITVNLTEGNLIVKNVKAEICKGYSYQLPGGTQVSLPGIYSDTLTSGSGCDSIIITNLITHEKYTTELTFSICDGDTFAYNGKQYYLSGIYADTLQSEYGCDSILSIRLNTISPSVSEQHLTLCPGEIFTIGNSSYSRPGAYIDTLVSGAGCDSIVTTNLDYFKENIYYQEFVWCAGDSFLVGDKYYSAPGDYTDTIVSVNGCDSVLVVSLSKGSKDFCRQVNCRMFIPNAFSPNEDGNNDVFEVYSPTATVTAMQIFDRWGGLLYQSESRNPHWDGTSQSGKPLDSGVYIYTIRGVCGDGESFTKYGDITILR